MQVFLEITISYRINAISKAGDVISGIFGPPLMAMIFVDLIVYLHARRTFSLIKASSKPERMDNSGGEGFSGLAGDSESWEAEGGRQWKGQKRQRVW
jgi:hypothetical protein